MKIDECFIAILNIYIYINSKASSITQNDESIVVFPLMPEAWQICHCLVALLRPYLVALLRLIARILTNTID